MIPPVKTPADVLIVFFDKSQLHYYLQLARDAGGDEIERGIVQLKWMADGTQVELPVADGGVEIAQWIKKRQG